MKNFSFLAAVIAAFFMLSACAAVDRVGRVVDGAKDRGLDVIELKSHELNALYDRLEIEHHEDALRLERMGRLLGRIGQKTTDIKLPDIRATPGAE